MIFIIIMRIYIYYAFLVQRYGLQTTLNIVYTFQAFINVLHSTLIPGLDKAYYNYNKCIQTIQCGIPRL